MNSTDSTPQTQRGSFVIFALLLFATLGLLFIKGCQPNQVLFANDGPLGALKAEANRPPGIYTGRWEDLNWVGGAIPNPSPNFSALLYTTLSPEAYLNLGAPASMFLAGLCAWFFFRALRFSPWVCVVGGLAAGLNSNMLSNACWGQNSRPLSMAMAFLALGFLHLSRGPFLLRTLPAGLAIGLGVTEGFDIGAMFSICVAAYLFFYFLVAGKTTGEKWGKAITSVAFVALFAGIVAYQTIYTLLGTQLKDVAVMEQKSETPEEKRAKWDFATQWSISPMETLRVVIPGLFGYRMTDRSGRVYADSYWGKVGQTPSNPASRFNGSGEYAGVLVVVLAIYGFCVTFRKNGGATSLDKKCIWFWSIFAFVCLLLSWGRFAPFYQ
ncbi:MAG: hypothetical protein JWM68_1026, partial [Verrucomicrobiales bacterium]|nr:hypothetical protein [Verrucomicrobiales bacterium]